MTHMMLQDFKIFYIYVNSHVDCSGSERWSASSLSRVSLCGGIMSVGWR
jgi:hypothetical protein